MKAVIFDDVLHSPDQQRRYRVSGLELAFYEHGDDAEAVVAREEPDVVFVDFSLEAMRCGVEVVKALRATQRPLRIIAISSDAEHNQRLLAAGANDAVPKTHLRAYLKKLAEQHSMTKRLR